MNPSSFTQLFSRHFLARGRVSIVSPMTTNKSFKKLRLLFPILYKIYIHLLVWCYPVLSSTGLKARGLGPALLALSLRKILYNIPIKTLELGIRKLMVEEACFSFFIPASVSFLLFNHPALFKVSFKSLIEPQPCRWHSPEVAFFLRHSPF